MQPSKNTTKLKTPKEISLSKKEEIVDNSTIINNTKKKLVCRFTL